MVTLPTPPSFRLDGKRALVTGAGRGIGLAAAAALADAGAHVVLAARTRGEIDEAAEAIRAKGGSAEALPLDVTDLQAVQRAIRYSSSQGVLNVASAGNSNVDLQHKFVDSTSPNDGSYPVEDRTITIVKKLPTGW